MEVSTSTKWTVVSALKTIESRRAALAPCLLALLVLGCGAHPAAKVPESDTWDVAMIQGQRIGYSHTTVRQVNEGREPVVKVAQSMQVSLKRFGQPTNMEVNYNDTETLEGRLLEFELTAAMGATPMHTTGKVSGNRLELKVESQGQVQNHTIAWPAEAGGLLAPELSLRAAPMKLGEHRTVKHLNFDGQVYVTELTAKKEQTVELWNGKSQLLRINTVGKVESDAKEKPSEIKGALWTRFLRRHGFKAWIETMNMEFYRVKQEDALAVPVGAFDIGSTTLITVDRPVRRIHDTKWVKFRIHCNGNDPSSTFPAGPSQEVKRIDDHTAEVTVRAIRPVAGGATNTKDGKPSTAAADAPTDDDLKPNNFIQSDDPSIVAQAKEAAGDETDPWKRAIALEAFVHNAMTVVDFSQAFATAAEVAQTRLGDCKGHAVYLAALARSLKIPARVVVGLVYMPPSKSADPKPQTFGGHMWTEVYIGGRWIGLDATLGKGGIGGGHLQISHSSMAGVASYDVFYPVLKILDGLKIEVLDYE